MFQVCYQHCFILCRDHINVCYNLQLLIETFPHPPPPNHVHFSLNAAVRPNHIAHALFSPRISLPQTLLQQVFVLSQLAQTHHRVTTTTIRQILIAPAVPGAGGRVIFHLPFANLPIKQKSSPTRSGCGAKMEP